MLYRIISSLSDEQVDDVFTQFEKEIFKHKIGTYLYAEYQII